MDKKDTSKSFADRLALTLNANRKAILITIASIVLLIIIALIVVSISTNNTEKAMLQADQILLDLQQWSGMEAGAEKDALEAEIVSSADELIAKGKVGYPLARAHQSKGILFFLKEDYENAAKSFDIVSTTFTKSYLAPVALANAAVCYEYLGRTDEAISRLQTIVDTYGSVSSESPHALFSIGRLYETTDTAAAIMAFQQLTEEYPDSEWANLANSRLIALQ